MTPSKSHWRFSSIKHGYITRFRMYSYICVMRSMGLFKAVRWRTSPLLWFSRYNKILVVASGYETKIEFWGKRRALIIGIAYKDIPHPSPRSSPLSALSLTHTNAQEMQRFLAGMTITVLSRLLHRYSPVYWTEYCQFKPEDITLMMDNEDIELQLRPTYENIVCNDFS